jgi:hypothetical protein
MIKIFLNEDNKLAIKSNSLFQSSILLWSLTIVLRLLDSWIIMVIAGGIHHIFSTSWAPPNFLVSMAISAFLTSIKYSNLKIQEVLKPLDVK